MLINSTLYAVVVLVMDVYEAILDYQWENCVVKLKVLERQILSILWNLAETPELRRSIFSHKNGGFGLCKKSLLRLKLEEGGTIVDNTEVAFHRNSSVLVNCMESALGLLCK